MRNVSSFMVAAAVASLSLGALALSCGDEKRADDAVRGQKVEGPAPAQPSAIASPSKPAAEPTPVPAQTAPTEPIAADATETAGEPGTANVAAPLEDGFAIAGLVVAKGVEQRQPVEPGTSFAATEPLKLYAFFNVVNPARAERELSVSWLTPDGKERGAVPLSIPNQPKWKTWAFHSGIKKPGRWEAIVRTADGQEIGRAPFEITE